MVEYAGQVNEAGCGPVGFVAGSLIQTPLGDMPVDQLVPGDLVNTLDNGPQRLVAVDQFCIRAEDQLAFICIHAGTLGPHQTVFLPPDYRIVICDSLAGMLFGDAEVLVAAKDLVNGRSVIRIVDGMVDLVQLIFDGAQVVTVQGLATECPAPKLSNYRDIGQPLAAPRRALYPFEAQVLMTAAA